MHSAVIIPIIDKTWQGCSVALPPWLPTISEIQKMPSSAPRQPARNLVAGMGASPCVAARKAGPSTTEGRWWNSMRLPQSVIRQSSLSVRRPKIINRQLISDLFIYRS